MSQETMNEADITNKGVISSLKNYVKNLVENVQVPAAKTKANTKTRSKPYSSSIYSFAAKSTTNDINEHTLIQKK